MNPALLQGPDPASSNSLKGHVRSLAWSLVRFGLGAIETTGTASRKVRLKIDPKYFRPTEVDLLIGDYAKARKWRLTAESVALLCRLCRFRNPELSTDQL